MSELVLHIITNVKNTEIVSFFDEIISIISQTKKKSWNTDHVKGLVLRDFYCLSQGEIGWDNEAAQLSFVGQPRPFKNGRL